MPVFAKFAAALVATVQSGIENAFSRKQTPMPNISYPGDNCCTFFADPGYSGESLNFCHNGKDTFEVDMRYHGFNDKVSSYMCGHSVAYDLCNDPVDMSC